MEEDREVRLCSVNNSLDAQCIVDLLKILQKKWYHGNIRWEFYRERHLCQ